MNSKPDTISIHRALDLTTQKKTATTLSEFIWKLKEYHLSWDIIERAPPYSAVTNRCNLCREIFHSKNKTKPQQKKGKSIHPAPTSDNFVLRLKHQCRMKRI